jgi:hypothetical protein
VRTTKLASIIVIAAITCALAVGSRFAGAQTPPSGYSHFTNAVTLWVSGSNVIIQANAVPDHKSPYFTTPGDPRYEADTNPNFAINPNHIETKTIEFRIPANPQVAATHAATPLGPIGVAVNGVPLFNQYAGPNQPLTNEINSFDQYDGHPQQTSMYHYHVEPYALTTANGKNSLIGYLLDGFPVYGPLENGVTITTLSGVLDTYHGHIHATADYPGGIYHYHITADAPYINGTGFYGTADTVTYTLSASPTPTATSAAATPTSTNTASPATTATPTAAVFVPGVGGIAEEPDLARAAAARSSASGGHATLVVAMAAAFAATIAAGTWYAFRGRRQP